ncbi:helix-turn-helix domain-containing protein [Absicoccus porci]|uniref:helix-turn-helix domain-containing protein n=1 Tax=Absicoccus porci TaxID=2486576 RepID=UPI003F8ACAA6
MKKEMSEETTNKIATKTSQHKKDKDDFMEKNFIPNLRKALDDKGMKQSELATKIDVSPQVISNWLGNRATPDILDLSRISDVLDIPIDRLCGKNEEHINSDIESFKGLLTSIWKQCIFCDDNNLQFIVNEGEVVFDNVDFELAVANDDLKRPKFLNIYIENNQVQEFLKNLNTFKGLYKNGTITKEQFNDFMESQIEKLAQKNEEEKRNKESKM